MASWCARRSCCCELAIRVERCTREAGALAEVEVDADEDEVRDERDALGVLLLLDEARGPADEGDSR